MVKLEIVPKIIAKKLPYEGWVKMWDITCLFITLDQPFLYPQLILVSLWKRFLENMSGNRKCFAPSVKKILNFHIKTKPVMPGADATIYVWLKCTTTHMQNIIFSCEKKSD